MLFWYVSLMVCVMSVFGGSLLVSRSLLVLLVCVWAICLIKCPGYLSSGCLFCFMSLID